MEKSTFVPSTLTAKASKALQEEVAGELKIKDPSSEQAKATIEKATSENTP